MNQLVTSLMTSHHIDYCNSVMVRLTPSIIYLVSSPTGPECSSSAYSWSQSTIPSHHSCSTTTPLVTSEIPDHLQSCYAHAQHVPPLCHSYLSDLVTFCSSDPHRLQLRSSTVRSAKSPCSLADVNFLSVMDQTTIYRPYLLIYGRLHIKFCKVASRRHEFF